MADIKHLYYSLKYNIFLSLQVIYDHEYNLQLTELDFIQHYIQCKKEL